jgi:predicted SnoaL-like aldol condensation-catalyzing enzyme
VSPRGRGTSLESRVVSEKTRPVEELIDCLNKREFRRATHLYSPGYVNHDPLPIAADGAPNDGTRGIRGLAATLPDCHCDIVQCVEKGNLVVLHTHVEGHNTHGELVAADFITVFRVEDGLIQESWGLVNSLELARQLGITLEPSQA